MDFVRLKEIEHRRDATSRGFQNPLAIVDLRGKGALRISGVARRSRDFGVAGATPSKPADAAATEGGGPPPPGPMGLDVVAGVVDPGGSSAIVRRQRRQLQETWKRSSSC
jgi:hypothetical protein